MVTIPSAEEFIVPRPDADANEEARVLYVAVTRAKRFLFCTWSGRRTTTSQSGLVADREHSSFLTDVPVESQDGDDCIEKTWPQPDVFFR